MSLTVRPLSHALGAEIAGVDLAKPLSNAEFDQIHRTFLDKGILVFRDQAITREQHIAFSRALSDGMKKMIADLHGIHTGSRKIVDLASDRAAEQRKLNPPIA